MSKEQCFAEEKAKLQFYRKDDLLNIINNSKENAILKAVALDKLLELKMKKEDFCWSKNTLNKYINLKHLPEQCILLYQKSFYEQQKGAFKTRSERKNIFNTTHLTELTRFLYNIHHEEMILNITTVIVNNNLKSTETTQWCDFISKNSYNGNLAIALCSQAGYEYYKIIGNAGLQRNDLWKQALQFTETKTLEQWFMQNLNPQQQKLLVEKLIHESIYKKKLLFSEQKLYQMYQDYFCHSKNYELKNPVDSDSDYEEKELVIDLSPPLLPVTKLRPVRDISQPSTSKVSSMLFQQTLSPQVFTSSEIAPSQATPPNRVSLATLANEVAKTLVKIASTQIINKETTAEVENFKSLPEMSSQLILPLPSVVAAATAPSEVLVSELEQTLQAYSKEQLLTIIRDNKKDVLSQAIAVTNLQEMGVTNEEIGWQETTIKKYTLIRNLPEECQNLYLQYYHNPTKSEFIFSADHLYKLTKFLVYRHYDEIINEITNEIISKELSVEEVGQWCKYIVKKSEDNDDYVLDSLYRGKQYEYFKNITNFSLKKYTLWDEACYIKKSKNNIISWFTNDLSFDEQKELVEMAIYKIEKSEPVQSEHKKIVSSLHKKYSKYYCVSNNTAQFAQQENVNSDEKLLMETEFKIADKIDKIISVAVANKNSNVDNKAVASTSEKRTVPPLTINVEQTNFLSKRKNDKIVGKTNIWEKKQKINVDVTNKTTNEIWQAPPTQFYIVKPQPFHNILSLLKEDSLLVAKHKLQGCDKEMLLSIVRNKYSNPIVKMLVIEQLKERNIPTAEIGWNPATLGKYTLIRDLPDECINLFYQAIEAEKSTCHFFKLKHLTAVASLLDYPDSHPTIIEITKKIIKEKFTVWETNILCKDAAKLLKTKMYQPVPVVSSDDNFASKSNNNFLLPSTSKLPTHQAVSATVVNLDTINVIPDIQQVVPMNTNTSCLVPTMVSQNKIFTYEKKNTSSLSSSSTSRLLAKQPLKNMEIERGSIEATSSRPPILQPKQAPTSTEMNWESFYKAVNIPKTIAAASTSTFDETYLMSKKSLPTSKEKTTVPPINIHTVNSLVEPERKLIVQTNMRA